jgi:uncharacterized protein YciI
MLFSFLIHDEPDTTALRDVHRTAHLAYLKTFDDQTIFAGPFTDDEETQDLGSFRIIDLPDRAAADTHVADEPYVTGGIQKSWSIHRTLGATAPVQKATYKRCFMGSIIQAEWRNASKIATRMRPI